MVEGVEKKESEIPAQISENSFYPLILELNVSQKVIDGVCFDVMLGKTGLNPDKLGRVLTYKRLLPVNLIINTPVSNDVSFISFAVVDREVNHGTYGSP